MGIQALLNQFVGWFTILLGQVGAIYQELVATRISIVIHDTAAEVSQTLAIVSDPGYGLAAQEGQLVSMQAQLTTLLADVVALGAPQQTAVPVTLPAVPPAGYGGPTTSAIGDAVWLYQSSDENTAMGLIMSMLSVFLRVMTDSGTFQSRLGLGFSFNVGLVNFINNPNTSFIHGSIADIQPTDASLLDFLQREIGSVVWQQTGQGTYWADVGGGNALIQCDINEGQFQWLRFLAGGPPPNGWPIVPPVWPGLASVTLGAPAALAGTGITVVGPMDGIVVDLTSVPQPLPFYDFNGSLSWGKIGAVAFEDDNGNCEEMQLLGFEHAVYVPKSMKQASFCNIRLKSGTLGTATPWTKT